MGHILGDNGWTYNGKLMRNFISNFDLFVANQLFAKGQPTFSRFGGTSIIDFLLLPHEHFHSVASFEVGDSQESKLSDFHHPIFVEFEFKFTRTNKVPKICLRTLKGEKILKFQRLVEEHFDEKLMNEIIFLRDKSRFLTNEEKVQAMFAEFYFHMNKCLIKAGAFSVSKPFRVQNQISKDQWKLLCEELMNDNPHNPQVFFRAFRKYVRPKSDYLPIDPENRIKFINDHFSNNLDSEFAQDIRKNIKNFEQISKHLIGALDYEISEDEILEVLEKMKSNTATGIDCLSVRNLKLVKFLVTPFLKVMYNFAFSSTSLPKFQHFARIASFCKPGKPPDKPGSYRNVFVSPTVSRVLDGVSANRMKILLDPQISSAQGGFRDNIGTLEHVFVLREIIISANRTDRPLILGFFDIKGAFDRVPIPELLFKLWNSGIQGKFWDFMEHAYSNMYAFFMQNNQIFVPTLSAGLRQGGKSSPILWNLFFNDLEKDLRNHNVSEYEFDPNFLPSLFFLLYFLRMIWYLLEILLRTCKKKSTYS